MPMFHTAGCVMGALGTLQPGGTHVPVLAFDPGFVLELLERERGTAMLGVPTMLIALLEHPDSRPRDLSSCGRRCSGGSRFPPSSCGESRRPRRPLLHRLRDHRVLTARHA